ncbi:Alpha/Beta hydrolase protein [Aspergillus granulosus]|uniref:Alpha/Beta hydrolase protein n=1 Tax=Aspergillus granulosus TaxID=176169 RepID=A0ABR4GTI4_9EURO
MAEAGFVVVAFDASFQGASGGTPRFVENPEFRVSDFRYVVDYIQKSLPYIDAERIGVLGICGGGGYALNAAMTDYRFKCSVGVHTCQLRAPRPRSLRRIQSGWRPREDGPAAQG